ncbi:hypothetical protein [Asticcacaulis taihuensis]|uniref:hypothetical protein n=1 Tax=Asticcacaulis taihuensis TaxID=260084 RepID=UPI0026ED256F|nr:hypothetical protein [Asticcacaulis taihuensis]
MIQTETLILADGRHDQGLVPGVAAVPAQARDIAALEARKAARRGNASLPAGGLFDDTARNQLDLF